MPENCCSRCHGTLQYATAAGYGIDGPHLPKAVSGIVAVPRIAPTDGVGVQANAFVGSRSRALEKRPAK